MKSKTCFVIIGYGKKTDYSTGRELDLDRSYENLIKPVFNKLGIECFRSIDRNYESAGHIDTKMFGDILKSDLVVADVSTLNPNAIYELGIRHALRPYTTIIISEEGTTIPFDFGHNIVEFYKHLGEDIGVTEAQRFKEKLEKKVKAVMDKKETDSPVYTFFPELVPPSFSKEEKKEIKNDQQQSASEENSISFLLEEAENAKSNGNPIEAKVYLKMAIEKDPTNVYLKQRLALVTYKSELPDKESALREALLTLQSINNSQTTDPETLGLSGAVYKRLYEITGERSDFDHSISFYSKGFYVKNDYYNGINLAYLYSQRAAELQKDRMEALVDFTMGNRIRKEVIEICKNLIESSDFDQRSDQNWIYLTLAEAYSMLGKKMEEAEVVEEAYGVSEGIFDIETYKEQQQKLKTITASYTKKLNLNAFNE